MTPNASTSHSINSSAYDASTVRVVNNEETALAMKQNEQIEQEQTYDDHHHPLSCMDNACEAMIGFFGAGSDAQDDELETVIMSAFHHHHEEEENGKERSTNGGFCSQDTTTTTTQFEEAAPPQEQAPSVTISTETPVKEEEKAPKRTFPLLGRKKTPGRTAPKGVTVDDDQVEARRKKGFGRWWKKRTPKRTRSKSLPRTPTRDTVPPSPSTVGSTTMEPSTDYVDMTNEYSHQVPQTPESIASAASFTPRPNRGADSDSESEEDFNSVWKELNDMWEESGHDMVRVISDNLSVKDAGANQMEEEDVIALYEKAVLKEQSRKGVVQATEIAV